MIFTPTTHYRYWIIAYPDLINPVGGIKQLHRVSEIIASTGRQCRLIQDSEDFHPVWFNSTVSTISKDNFSKINLDPKSDCVIFPETYVPVIKSFVEEEIPKIIFNQNASYTFGLPDKSLYKPDSIVKLYSHKSVKQIWCVSQYDRNFIFKLLGIDPSLIHIIKNSIDVTLNFRSVRKKRQIAFMPRKNKKDALVVQQLFVNSQLKNTWSLFPIVDKTHEEVISHLSESLVFFSFGHPEGFGLPVAEAMACGCSVIGYSGLGGRELFNHSLSHPINFEVMVGDHTGFIESLDVFNAKFLSNSRYTLDLLRQNSLRILREYSHQMMYSSILHAIEGFELAMTSSHL